MVDVAGTCENSTTDILALHDVKKRGRVILLGQPFRQLLYQSLGPYLERAADLYEMHQVKPEFVPLNQAYPIARPANSAGELTLGHAL